MSILPLIENCINEQKIDKILITSITLSSGKVIEKKYKKITKVVHQFLPLDIPIFINKFLKHWNPNLSVFIDSEIWPNLIVKIKEKNIPLLLVNARITKKSFDRWKKIISFSKKIFGKFDLCIVSNKETENYLKILGAKNIKSYGNLKFANSNSNTNYELDPSFLTKIKNRKIWCAASTHSSEEVFCAKLHLELKKNYNNILTIIIPRHIDRIEAINKELSNLNLKITFFSKLNELDINTDILLVDAYGVATKFYNISKCVFLGKSLVESLKMNSGQNPIEPARLGCKVFHGPNISNFIEIYKYLNTLGITKEINSANQLKLSLVEELKEQKIKDNKISIKIESYGQNILDNTINFTLI